MKHRPKVYVGMSGGVDSSVAAALLKEQGYDVVGVFMKNWSNDEFTECPWERDFADAKTVGEKLGIPVISWNFEREYREKVIEYFFAEYAAGRTPNPDVMCNKEIKFGLFLEKALRGGADYVATGHYARIVERKSEGGRERLPGQGERLLAIPKDTHKDQTYFLYTLTNDLLKKVIFPLADLTKEEVRAEARQLGLPNAEKPDSQGICFIGEVNIVNLLKSRLPEKVGAIRTIDGGTIGEHRGIWFYTIGQRHGLGIGGLRPSRAVGPEGGIPYYVADKDVRTNTLVVAPGSDHPALYSKKMNIENLSWRADTNRLRVQVRIRHGGALVPATIAKQDGEKAKIQFDEEQRAVTPGQAAVVYKDGLVIGGGTITEKATA